MGNCDVNQQKAADGTKCGNRSAAARSGGGRSSSGKPDIDPAFKDWVEEGKLTEDEAIRLTVEKMFGNEAGQNAILEASARRRNLGPMGKVATALSRDISAGNLDQWGADIETGILEAKQSREISKEEAAVLIDRAQRKRQSMRPKDGDPSFIEAERKAERESREQGYEDLQRQEESLEREKRAEKRRASAIFGQ